MGDYDYAKILMSLARIPKHNLNLDEASKPERVRSHEELLERYNKKLEDLRSKNKVTNLGRSQRKLKAKLKKSEKKKLEKEQLKQKLMKVGKNAGNMNKFKNDVK